MHGMDFNSLIKMLHKTKDFWYLQSIWVPFYHMFFPVFLLPNNLTLQLQNEPVSYLIPTNYYWFQSFIKHLLIHPTYSLNVVCHVLSYVRLCNPMDCSPPGSSVHGIFQARILEGVATPSSKGSSHPGFEHPVSPALQADSLSTEPLGKSRM